MADHPSAICFLFLVYMQRLVLFLSVRIFVAAYAKKILLFYPSPFLPSLSPGCS